MTAFSFQINKISIAEIHLHLQSFLTADFAKEKDNNQSPTDRIVLLDLRLLNKSSEGVRV